MAFEKGDILHIYNRGNNKQPIFFSDDNYRYFLRKVSDYIAPSCDILAYCLMPNHFHFLVQANEVSCREQPLGRLVLTELTNSFRLLQSSYAAAINKNRGLTGSLFQQKAKFKVLYNSKTVKQDYLQCCFHYIHQNPVRAELVTKLEDWPYSSFGEYLNEGQALCNKQLAHALLDIPAGKFYEMSCGVLDESLLAKVKWGVRCQ